MEQYQEELTSLCATFRIAQRPRRVRAFQSKRLREIHYAFITFSQTLPSDAVVPSFRSIVNVDTIQSIILDDRDDYMSTRADINNAFQEINAPSLAAQFKVKITHHLLNLLEFEDKDLSPLALATSLFQCRACKANGLTSVIVFSHRCPVRNFATSTHWLPIEQTYHEYCAYEDADPQHIVLDSMGHERMLLVLQACLLPESATLEQLQSADPFLECDGSD